MIWHAHSGSQRVAWLVNKVTGCQSYNSYQRHCTVSCNTTVRRSRGGQGVRTRPPPPPGNNQNLGLLSNTGPDPLKDYKGAKPAFNVGPSSARQWWPAVVCRSSLSSSPIKKLSKLDPLWQNFLDPRMTKLTETSSLPMVPELTLPYSSIKQMNCNTHRSYTNLWYSEKETLTHNKQSNHLSFSLSSSHLRLSQKTNVPTSFCWCTLKTDKIIHVKVKLPVQLLYCG